MDKEHKTPYILILPSVLLLAVLYGYPVLLTIWQSFNKTSLLTADMKFVGLMNYKEIFTDPYFYKTLSITAQYTILTVAMKIILGFVFAYLLYRDIFFKKQLRFLMLIPWAIPQVAVSTVWKWILDGNYGYINYYLFKLGITEQSINFLSAPDIAFFFTSFVDTWMGIPLVCLMFLAGLETIPKSLYEAAEMDGATEFRKFKDITLPGIKNVFTTILILVTIWSFNSFNVIYVLTGGGPMRATETLIIKIYQEAFSRFDLSMAAALSVITVAILSVMTLIYLKGLKKNAE